MKSISEETSTNQGDHRDPRRATGQQSGRSQRDSAPPVSLPSVPELAVGVYAVTKDFRAIPLHTCVCEADGGKLIAVTGPSGDADSERYARLFAASLLMLDALKRLRDAIRTNGRLVGWNSSDLDYVEAVIACAEQGTPVKFAEEVQS